MLIKSPNVHFKVINISLALVLCLLLLALLPHQSAPFFSWLNYSLYQLMFVQCCFILKREHINKDIFVNIGLFSFLYGFSFLNLFIGAEGLIGNAYWGIYVFQYKKMLFCLSIGISVVYIILKYIAVGAPRSFLYGATFIIVGGFLIWCFYPILLDKDYIVSLPDYAPLYKGILKFTIFVFFVVCLYGIFLYKNERSLEEHINSLMVCFFIMTILDIIDLTGSIYQTKLFAISQYVLLVILIFFIITLFRKIDYIYSSFGRFYEQLVVAGNSYGVPIKRKKSVYANAFLEFFRAYFERKKNLAGVTIVGAVLMLNYLNVSNYLKINIAAGFVGLLILSFYLMALYRKRDASGDLIAKSETLDKGEEIPKTINKIKA